MTPKQKASNLYDKMTVDFSIDKWQTKQCALIAVDEILEVVKFYEEKNGRLLIDNIRVMYWQEVKKELELL
jgi:hypothetical protein